MQARPCLCQAFSGSELYEKVRHSDRISQNDLFTPRLSLLNFPPLTPVTLSTIPSWHRWRWVAPKSHSAGRPPVGGFQHNDRVEAYQSALMMFQHCTFSSR
ncbi:hypothetical protein INR49_014542 [Caranx melampygus]|nr:hypothetical protein INR49_014542 [Caranx melampygus]